MSGWFVESGMTWLPRDEAERCARFVAGVTEHLRLHAQVRFMSNPTDEDEEVWAFVRMIDGTMTVQLKLCSEWLELEEEDQYKSLIHEACHVLHRDVMDVIDDARSHMGYAAFNPWIDQVKREFEKMVDHLSYCLAEQDEIVELWQTIFRK